MEIAGRPEERRKKPFGMYIRKNSEALCQPIQPQKIRIQFTINGRGLIHGDRRK